MSNLPTKVADPNTAMLLADLSRSFDHAPWAVTELSGDTPTVRYANAAFCQLIDKAPDEVIGRPFDSLLLPADECVALVDRVFRTGAPATYTAEAEEAPYPLLYSYSLWPVMANSRTAGVIIQINETGPLHETRQAISQALLLGALRQDELLEAAEFAKVQLQTQVSEGEKRENEAKMLMTEVAHRVKNSLHIIIALISSEIKRTPSVLGYRAMQTRIMAIAQLYDLMSRSRYGRTIALDQYLVEIARSISTSLLGGTSGIELTIEADAIEIDSDRAVPLGLLVNELSTNAVKHAFPGGIGRVTIAVRRIGNDVELKISDDGIGMAVKEPGNSIEKHGSDYVQIFVRQLRGALVRSATPGVGTTVTIRFPLAPERKWIDQNR